ncbi:MAG: hypothetical protein HOP15_09605 [Planctomycetes bacterium]|nr:hypothetical protein [Planctomycetota bacterium]
MHPPVSIRSIPSLARAPLARRRAALLAVLLLAAAPSAEDGSDRPLHAQHPRTVAVLETRAPDVSRFLLRATVPLPPGIFPRADGQNPLTVLDFDGAPLRTQIELVSRYPAEADGADVVEVLAQVRRDPALAPGALAQYAVIARAQAGPLPHGAVEPLPDVVRALLQDPSGIEIAAWDCFGNQYVSRPFDGSGARAELRGGPLQSEARVYQDMLPVNPVKGSTLPHFLGVHAYLSLFRGTKQIGLDLRFHNAHDGHDTTSERDDPLDKLYFQRIEISMPADWVLLQDFPDPLFGSERLVGGRRIVALVGPNPSGGLHVMRWQGQFHRRLMLAYAEPAAVTAARARLDGAGRAFCTRGFQANGREHWSWWNADTARYFPQKHQLPRLDHVGRSALDAALEGEFAFVTTHLANGTGHGDYPIASGRLGWGHPYGVSYGGMTSGLEINCYDGITLAAAASPRGYRLYTALHRMQTDRQPNALYRLDGEPSSVEEWLIENGNLDYVPFEHFVVPLLTFSNPDPFGIRSAPRFQIDFVQANGLAPAYEPAHFAFDPHDYQHFIRITRAAKVLAWLGNDSLAIDDLRLQAEMFNLSYHSNANTSGGGAQGSGLLSQLRFVRAFPGKGSFYGRGEAWGLDCAVAAYSLGEPEWRAQKLPWLFAHADLLLEGQATCSGFLQGLVSNKAVEGKYRARQQVEQSITENALVGLEKSVFRGAYPGYSRMVRDVLVDSLRAFIGELAWFPGQPGPWRYTGIGPLDLNQPVWCARTDMPSDAWTAGDIEAYQDWSSFAYGFELTGDPVFLLRARTQSGGATFQDLVTSLHDARTDNLVNRAALLALVQKLTGQL